MKTIEEKAEAYDRALKVLHKYDGAHIMLTQDLKEEMFPELKEPDDEGIRNAIINIIKSQKEQQCHINGEVFDKMLAWLEKQGEHANFLDMTQYIDKSALIAEIKERIKSLNEKSREVTSPISIMAIELCKNECELILNNINTLEMKETQEENKVESRFKVGDWIVFNGLTLYVKEVVEGYYRTISRGGIPNSYDWDIDNVARLWTIQDAKDGDVLSDGTTIFIFKDLLSGGSVMSYCDYDTDSGENDAFCPLSVNLMCSKITPATKEQRDTLERAMTNAGYEWDAEKKELKEIEKKPTETADNSHTWKPSKEQMDVLLSEVTAWTKGCPKQKVLKSLYNDLKKLTE